MATNWYQAQHMGETDKLKMSQPPTAHACFSLKEPECVFMVLFFSLCFTTTSHL